MVEPVDLGPEPDIEPEPEGCEGSWVEPKDLVLPESSGVRAALRSCWSDEVWGLTYGDPGQDTFLKVLQSEYQRWVSIPTYLAVQHRTVDGVVDKKIAVLGAKRGNGPYRARIRRRVDKLRPQVNQLVSVTPATPTSGGRAQCRTNGIFLTLTVGAEGKSLGEAWLSISKAWNRVVAGLRARYGPVAFVRAYEAHATSGYPHVHALVVFTGRRFLAYAHDRRRWNVQRSAWGGEQETLKAGIERSWRLGNADISAVRVADTGVNYIMKYILGEGKGWDPVLNRPVQDTLSLALTWFFNRRSWSASYFDLTLDAHLKSLRQLGLSIVDDDVCFSVVSEDHWELLGVFELQSHGDRPPPWEIDLLDRPDMAGRVRSLERERRKRMARMER